MSIHRSVGTQSEILKAIKSLHCPEGFECDITYGHGKFYDSSDQDLLPPLLKFDIQPMVVGVTKACSTSLPIASGSLSNVLFDPPFLTYVRAGRIGNDEMIMAKRFGGYWRYDELLTHYTTTIDEVKRVLKPKGKMIVKCQDIIHDHRMQCTHLNVVKYAEANGFRLLDLFILPSTNRMKVVPANKLSGVQKHARVHHSYFLVLVRV